MEFKRQTKKPPAPHNPPAAPASRHSDTPKDKHIHISINLGPFTNFRQSSSERLRQISRSKWIIITVVAVTALAVGAVSYYALVMRVNTPQEEKAPALNKLEYQTLTPDGKPTEKLGGWHRVSPPESAPAYAYVDTIDSVGITVSQQPLPDKFIEGTDAQLAELAKSFGATNEIKADGIKVYVGTSAKGPQSAILIKDGLLILIKSQSKISDEAWARYAESLK